MLVFMLAHLVAQQVIAVEIPTPLREVGVTERLGESVALADFSVIDEQGETKKLSEYFVGKPVIFQLIYYGCPMMCGFVFEGTQKLVREVPWAVSDRYHVVSLSMNPRETAALAREKKEKILGALPESLRDQAAKGWHFLTATEATSLALGQATGVAFKYDTREKQYAHPAVSVVLSPEGKITRYLYGFEHKAQDVKLALLEATQGKIGTVIDRVLMFCYRYDPSGRTYSLYAMRLVQAGSTATVLALGGFVLGTLRRERRKRAPKGEKRS